MTLRSAGVMLFRRSGGLTEVFLAHPGGPYWSRKDEGAWTIPKGLIEAGEEPLAAARREFREETGRDLSGELIELGEFRQSGGKIVTAYALEGEFDPKTLASNAFTMEWPPRSGLSASFPEVDRAGWFRAEQAQRKLLPGQRPILAALLRHLGVPPAG